MDFDARNTSHDQAGDRTVWRFANKDNTRFLDIVVTSGGNFKFVESELLDDDGTFIVPVKWSGLYSSAADPERDARTIFDWLRDARREEDGSPHHR